MIGTLRISPSMLEQFRVCNAGLFGKGDADFIEYVRGEFKGNEATSLGSAWHSVIENGVDAFHKIGNDLVVFEEDMGIEWRFAPPVQYYADGFRKAYKGAVAEVWGHLFMEIDGYRIVSRLRVDGIWGRKILETKTTKSAFPVVKSDYEESVQWRMYLMAFPDAQSVVYTKFQFRENKENPRIMETCEVHSWEMHRTPTIEMEVRSKMKELIQFLERNNMVHELMLEPVK